MRCGLSSKFFDHFIGPPGYATTDGRIATRNVAVKTDDEKNYYG